MKYKLKGRKIIMKRKIFALTIITMMLFSFSVIVSADNDVLIEGISNYYSGDYNQTIEKLDEFLKGDNQYDVDALYFQTLAYIHLNQVTNAKENMKILNDNGYSFGIINWKLGKLYLNENGYYDSPFYNEAKRELELAKQLGISSAGLHSDLATAYQGLGNFDKAAAEYEQAINKGAVLGDYINLAALYKEIGKLDPALTIYKKAIEEDPNNASIYSNMGDIYLEKEQYQEAIDILNRGVKLNNSLLALKTKLANAYYHNRDYEMAKKHYTDVINTNANIYQGYYYLGEIYYKVEKNIELAINYYEQAVSYNRNYVKAYLSLGDLYLDQDETYKAMAQYLKALESNSNYPDAHYRLALAYQKMNMKQAAIEELRKTLHLDSSNNDARLLLNKLQAE